MSGNPTSAPIRHPLERASLTPPLSRDEESEADALRNDLRDGFGVEVEKDWGYKSSRAVRWWPPAVVSSSQWEPGRWTIIEMQTVREALSDLAALMGGDAAFRRFIGYASVRMSATACGRGCAHATSRLLEFKDAGKPPTKVDISNSHNIDKWTVVHEFGHAWDRNSKWRVSKKLEHVTGGRTASSPANGDPHHRLPGCNKAGYVYGGTPPKGSDINFNRREDFAEAVTAAVYPDTAHAAIQRYQHDPLYGPLLYYADYRATPRWEFIQKLIDGTIAC